MAAVRPDLTYEVCAFGNACGFGSMNNDIHKATAQQLTYNMLLLCRSVMLIEKHVLKDVLGDGGWESKACVRFKHLRQPPATARETNVVFNYKPGQVCV